MADQNLESTSFPDQFLLEHGKQIRELTHVLESPKTNVGEACQNKLFNNPILMVYNRLHPLYSSFISLIEFDEIGKAEGKNYFSEPTNQIMVLKATNLLMEDGIKFPYDQKEGDKKVYSDYRGFFENTLQRLGQFEKQIENGQKTPNFVNSLAIIVSQEVNKMKGVENFVFNTDLVRKGVSEYLPELEKIEDGKILSEIRSRIESPLVSVDNI